MVTYHDTEWGVPVRDDRRHFEFLVLDAFQAGLSWAIILRKREGFRAAFAGFDPVRVSRFGPEDVERLRADPEIVRNRQKIDATIANAAAFLRVRGEFGSFDRFIWEFVSNHTIENRWRSSSEVPAKTDESEAMSAALRARGFGFVGPTICYAYMQAAGMVNDHTIDCFRHPELSAVARR
jgi:DNA-3-methyladenine glycosylase I